MEKANLFVVIFKSRMNNHHEMLAGSMSFIRYRKKYSTESSILKVRHVEAQQSLSDCSRELNDHQLLEQNSH